LIHANSGLASFPYRQRASNKPYIGIYITMYLDRLKNYRSLMMVDSFLRI
jgi:hypothetical protein